MFQLHIINIFFR